MASAASPASRAPRLDGPPRPVPPSRLLSNGRYRVLITPGAEGFSARGGTALTSWTADPAEGASGMAIHVRDRDSRSCWRIACRTEEASGRRDAEWRPGVFRITRSHDGIRATLEICVVPGPDAELRRVRLVNEGSVPRRLDLTTFAEIVLADAAAHRAHPAFSKLFLQTEHVEEVRAVLARRRPRARGERHPWLVHAAPAAARVEVETDRARFLGRGRPPGDAAALASFAPLSGTTGNVLDAVAALRVAVDLPAGGSAETTFVLGAADDREGAIELAAAFRDPGAVDRAFGEAERAERSRLAAAGLSEAEGEYFQALAGAMLYGHPGLRARAAARPAGESRHAVLRRHGIGDADLLAVVRGEAPAGAAAARDLARAEVYWSALGIPVRLLDERAVPPEDVPALLAAAQLVVADELPDLDAVPEAADARPREEAAPRRAAGERTAGPPAAPGAERLESLLHFNGYGGFSAAGDEYVIRLPRAADGTLGVPPNPWINVIANEDFGCIVSETGAGMTWSGNSRERRITHWSNDAVLDPHSEAFTLRDEETGDLWSPLPGPAPGPGDYETRHGFGASVFRTRAHGIESECTVFVPRGERVRVAALRLRNRGDRPRRLSAASYARLVLGSDAERDPRFVVTEADGASGIVFARSEGGDAFGDGLVFAAALGDGELESHTGSGLHPCFAQQVRVELAAGGTREIRFLLGEAAGPDEARACVARFRSDEAAARALEDVRSFWSRGSSAVRIRTPLPELDLLVNGWLPYQVLSCRLWGRSAFYQSGGAFGFRDQLQDSAALLWAWPERTRAQILLHAAHQFAEGDVLHWWHPPDSRGIRTRFTDDLLWLPYVAAHYVDTTGDVSVLNEIAPFLAARALGPGEAEAFLLPELSGEAADVYEHCCRAIDRSLVTGAHGLPLFGAGDWNDGMNRVGAAGRGESVWLAMFLRTVLGDFVPFCDARGDAERAARYRRHREDLRRAANEAAWDGDWYLRGWYDDGEALGSHAGDECRIDALVQAWAVLSGTAPPDRAARAMDAVEEHLISEPDGIIRLLTPPFDRTRNDPGYIRGYVPGVRENGGQYTHAALWVVRAMAELGRRDRAAALLALLNPVRHAADRARADVYRVEPYVVAADVYGEPPHVGRGGWTWYTGAAGWMYRVALESVLGVRVRDGRRLEIRPCVPDDWPEYGVTVRVPGGETRYEIRVTNPRGAAATVVAARLDGEAVAVTDGAVTIPLASDGGLHRVEVELGPEAMPGSRESRTGARAGS